jgi:hypothetical protein
MFEAEVSREKLLAEAVGSQEKGMAQVRIREADAAAIEKRGQAEAAAVKEKLVAEAAGLAQKAEAMKALDGVGREHEEFRITLEKEKAIELEGINARRDIARAQAEVMGKAMENAKVNIVGGDGQFFERFVQAITFGHSVDGAIDSSETLKTVLKDYLEGKANLPEDIKQVLSDPSVSTEGIQRLTISAALGKLMLGAKGEERDKLKTLLEKARELGIDKLPPK